MWRWYRGLKEWQRVWVASIVIDAVTLGGATAVLWALDFPSVATIVVVAAFIFLRPGRWLSRRAESGFIDENPHLEGRMRSGWWPNENQLTISQVLLWRGVKRGWNRIRPI